MKKSTIPIIPTGKELVLGSGDILELISFEVDVNGKKKMFEKARRSPGVRVMIYDEIKKKLLLSREYRGEQGKYDYRLPGGKVIDTLAEFRDFSGDMILEAEKAAMREAREETGIVIAEPELYYVSHCGANVEWDLYYYVSREFKDIGEHQRDDEGEADMTTDWYPLDEVREKIRSGEMSEDRSVGVLARWMMSLEV